MKAVRLRSPRRRRSNQGPERALACVRCLLRLGARVSEERPKGGLGTSVHQTAANGYKEALKELLAADGRVALEVFDEIGRTPLICAVQDGHLDEASLCLEAGADVNANDVEMIGNTALATAVQGRNLPMVELLLKHEADVQGPNRAGVSRPGSPLPSDCREEQHLGPDDQVSRVSFPEGLKCSRITRRGLQLKTEKPTSGISNQYGEREEGAVSVSVLRLLNAYDGTSGATQSSALNRVPEMAKSTISLLVRANG